MNYNLVYTRFQLSTNKVAHMAVPRPKIALYLPSLASLKLPWFKYPSRKKPKLTRPIKPGIINQA